MGLSRIEVSWQWLSSRYIGSLRERMALKDLHAVSSNSSEVNIARHDSGSSTGWSFVGRLFGSFHPFLLA